jgi:hypothetical protein
MKMKLPPFVDRGIKIISLIVLFFISLAFDRFTFGMMNVSNPISFGLGVSLFLGGNLISFYIAYKIVYSIFKFKIDDKPKLRIK